MKLIIKLFADDSLLFVSGRDIDEIKQIIKPIKPELKMVNDL